MYAKTSHSCRQRKDFTPMYGDIAVAAESRQKRHVDVVVDLVHLCLDTWDGAYLVRKPMAKQTQRQERHTPLEAGISRPHSTHGAVGTTPPPTRNRTYSASAFFEPRYLPRYLCHIGHRFQRRFFWLSLSDYNVFERNRLYLIPLFSASSLHVSLIILINYKHY